MPQAGATESVELEAMREPDHDTDYTSRRGYDPNFLDNAIAVPMPTAKDPTVLANTKDGKDKLDYQNFSLRMHAKRRLALLTACNVTKEPALRRPEAGRDYTRKGLSGLGEFDFEEWFRDDRLDPKFQIPDVFFTKDRKAFDKGHICRRDDVAWGRTYDELKRANGDSYHVTNCSPQVAGFNQSAKGDENWGDLENHVLSEAANERLCVFAGPVLVPSDQIFHGVGEGGTKLLSRIPGRFWKVIVARIEDGIAAYGFVLEQDLGDVDWEFAVPEEFLPTMYPIAKIAKMTGVVFDPSIVDADQFDAVRGVEIAQRAGIVRSRDATAESRRPAGHDNLPTDQPTETDMPSYPLQGLRSDDVVLDLIPDDVEASIRLRDEWLTTMREGAGAGLEFIVSDVSRWTPGQKVRVAFLGGDTALHKDIADATKEITGVANVDLDFGVDAVTSKYRTWSESDHAYSAEIRVSFDKPGFFSLVGTDSINPEIGAGKIGGRPDQCSLNLGGFPTQRPPNWPGVVRHEFMHALAFQHEHQNMRGPCEAGMRWDDDTGYARTQDPRGTFINDANGLRPGIYTYLSGFPNFWNKPKIDFNLRTQESPNVVAGPFEKESVMLYRFPALFYKDANNGCVPAMDGGISLSEGDKRGLRLLYPRTAQEVAVIETRTRSALEAVEASASSALEGLEAGEETAKKYAWQLAANLRKKLGRD